MSENARDKTNPARRDKRDGERTKKPFDKKTYRLKKYSNKYKVQQWEERRKKAILREYYKEVGKEQGSRPKPISLKDGKSEDGKNQRRPNAFLKAKQEFLQRKEEKKRQREEALRRKAEKEEAQKLYKQRKLETYKKLCKKTKKGQPVMKDRIELLLQKIESTTNQ